MPLEKQTIVVPLGSLGMDAGKDPKVSPGLLRAENVAYNLDGSVSKRTGYVLSATGATGMFVASKGSIDIAHGVSGAYTADGGTVQLSHHSHPLPDIAVSGLAHTQSDVYHYCDIGSDGTYTGLPYTRKSGSSYYSTVESFLADTLLPTQGGGDGAVTFGPFTGPRTARIVKVGSSLYYYYFDDTGVLWGGVFESGNGGIPQYVPDEYTSAVDALTTVYEWDACAITSGIGYVTIAYAGATAGKLCLLALPGGINAGATCTQIDNSSKPVSKPAIWIQSADNVGLGYVLDDTTWKLTGAIYKYDGTQVLGPTTLDSLAKATYTPHAVTGVAQSTTRSKAYWDVVAASVPSIRYRIFNTSGTVGSATSLVRRARIAWKPALSAVSYSPYPQHVLGVFTRSWGYSYGAQDSIVLLLDATPCGKVLLGKARTGDSYGMLPSMQPLVQTASNTRWLTVAEWLVEVDNSADNKNLYHLGQVVIVAALSQRQRLLRAGAPRSLPQLLPLAFSSASIWVLKPSSVRFRATLPLTKKLGVPRTSTLDPSASSSSTCFFTASEA